MARKHKKKVYTSPKKNGHVHKNEPLHVIKSISNPKCQCCDNRLALHHDRFTCSHCNISFPLSVELE